MHPLSILNDEIRPKIKFSSLNLRKRRGSQNFFCWKPSKWGEILQENPGIQADFCWILPDFYRECNFFRDKEVVLFKNTFSTDEPPSIQNTFYEHIINLFWKYFEVNREI